MSLILEALRKSEAERQRAQAPGLHAPMPMRPAPRAVAGPGPWLAAALGAALLAGTWWVTREPAAPAKPVPVTATAIPPAGVRATSPAPGAANARASAPAEAGARDAARFDDTPPREPPPDPVAAAAPPVASAPERAPDRAAPVLAAPRAGLPDPSPSPPSPPSTPPTAAETAPEPLPGLATLSADERAALPPLKVSMHVWSADPARRFAIVDGQRVGEGALLAGGTVAEIRPDGVVLDVADRRLLLPRP